MTPAISQGIVGVQVALLLLTLIIGLASRSQTAAKAMAWISTVLALVVIALAGVASAPGGVLGTTGDSQTWLTYGVIGFITAAVTWGAVAVVCMLATTAGFAIADATSGDFKAGINGFAAGALLFMLVDSMIPDATEKAGRIAGLVTVLGFAVAAGLS